MHCKMTAGHKYVSVWIVFSNCALPSLKQSFEQPLHSLIIQMTSLWGLSAQDWNWARAMTVYKDGQYDSSPKVRPWHLNPPLVLAAVYIINSNLPMFADGTQVKQKSKYQIKISPRWCLSWLTDLQVGMIDAWVGPQSGSCTPWSLLCRWRLQIMSLALVMLDVSSLCTNMWLLM